MAKYSSSSNKIKNLRDEDLRILRESAQNMSNIQDSSKLKELLSDPEILNFYIEFEQLITRRESKSAKNIYQTNDIKSREIITRSAPVTKSTSNPKPRVTHEEPEAKIIPINSTKPETNKDQLSFKTKNIDSMKTRNSIFGILSEMENGGRHLSADEKQIKIIGDEIAENSGTTYLLRNQPGLTLSMTTRSLVPGGAFGSEVLPGAIAPFAYSLLSKLPVISLQAKLGGTIPAVGADIASFYDQNDEAQDTALILATISHSPKRITVFVPFSAQLRSQSPEMQDQVLFLALQRACSAAFDKAVFGIQARSATIVQGLGYSTRYGVNTAKSSILPSWNKIMELEETLLTANALPDGFFWITNPRCARRLKQTPLESGYPQVILEKGLIDGISVLSSSSISSEGAISGDADLLILGNFNDLALISYGGVNIVLDNITRMKENIMTLIVDIFIDCKGLREPLATSDDDSTQTNDYSSSFGVLGITPSIGNQS